MLNFFGVQDVLPGSWLPQKLLNSAILLMPNMSALSELLQVTGVEHFSTQRCWQAAENL